MKTIDRDTFRKHRPGKAGGHARWLKAGAPRIPEHMESGVLAYQAGQTVKDIKASMTKALEKFKPEAPTLRSIVKGAARKMMSFLRRTP